MSQFHKSHKRYRKARFTPKPKSQPKPKSAGVLLLYKGDVLVVKERRKDKVELNTPGGKGRSNEKTHETAWREFQEETQLFQGIPNPLAETTLLEADKYYAVYVWEVEEKPDITKFVPNASQIGLEWVSYNKNPPKSRYILQCCLRALRCAKEARLDYSDVLRGVITGN